MPPIQENSNSQHIANAIQSVAQALAGGITVINAVYPVGSIYISVLSTNPVSLFGVGTWVAFGTGRTIVGVDTGQTEFDTVEETGGAKTHTLALSEIPAHTHTVGARDSDDGGTNGAVRGTDAGVTFPTGSSGGGGAHNNLQPYITVYMWKRTA